MFFVLVDRLNCFDDRQTAQRRVEAKKRKEKNRESDIYSYCVRVSIPKWLRQDHIQINQANADQSIYWFSTSEFIFIIISLFIFGSEIVVRRHRCCRCCCVATAALLFFLLSFSTFFSFFLANSWLLPSLACAFIQMNNNNWWNLSICSGLSFSLSLSTSLCIVCDICAYNTGTSTRNGFYPFMYTILGTNESVPVAHQRFFFFFICIYHSFVCIEFMIRICVVCGISISSEANNGERERE